MDDGVSGLGFRVLGTGDFDLGFRVRFRSQFRGTSLTQDKLWVSGLRG